ncbi:MAG: hypothetical protein AB7F89_10110 [Pirellulaceae bacterium]
MRMMFGSLLVGLVFGVGCGAQPVTDTPHADSPASADSPSSDTQPQPDVSSPAPESASPAPSDETGASGNASAAASTDAKSLALDHLTFTVPDGWQRKEAASSFVLAEWTLPASEPGTADARLTVSSAGGSVEDNIQRWRGQFGGEPEQSAQNQIRVDGMDVTIVELSGVFRDQRGPFSGGAPQSGYRMYAAILPVGETMYFVKAVGPFATLGAHVDRIRSFIESARRR